MNSTLRLLIIVAAALTGLIVIELALPSGGETEIAAAPDTPAAGAATEQQAGSASPADFATTILARPLFKPDRHPAPTDDHDASTAPPADLPRLTGIMMWADLKRAIFAPDGADKLIVVSEGDSVGDWRVQEIAADAVTMVGPDGTHRIRPKFAPSQAAITPGATDTTTAPEPPPAPAGPLPQIPKRGAANAHRHPHDNMRPPARKH